MMPTALVKRINCDYLNPDFLERLLNLLASASYEYRNYVCYFGYRSYKEQRMLYQAHQFGGPRAAPPGLSAHNYGFAVDVFYQTAGGKASWDEAFYMPLKELCADHKLAWGGDFKDWGHIGMPGYVSGAELKPLLKTWQALPHSSDLVKLQALWKSLPQGNAP